MKGRHSRERDLSRREYMRARRRRRGLKKLAALVAVSAFAVVVVATAFASRDTQASGVASGSPTSTLAMTSATVPPSPTATRLSAISVTSAGPSTTTVAPSTTTTAPSTTTTTIYIHAIRSPVRIVIPAIEVDAKVIHVGLLENGDMQVPSFGLAGWYKLGPAPGAGGPAVIVAHVDSKKGPDVFYRLKELEPGDEVVVYGKDGDSATFVVDSKEQRLKSELPADRIWNDTWEPVIRLITCGGDFDRDWGHYLSNVIAYGHLVK